jgi:hypothetical protein
MTFCFLYFISNKEHQKTFIIDDFKSRKRVGGQQCVFLGHYGSSAHQRAMINRHDLKNPSQQIHIVMSAQFS